MRFAAGKDLTLILFRLLVLAAVAALAWSALVPSFRKIALRKHAEVSWITVFLAAIALTPLCAFLSGSANRGVLFALAVIAASWVLALVQAWQLRREANDPSVV